MGRPMLLLEAAHSYRVGGEDRLTELFAATAAGHPGFCRGLFAEVGLPTGETHCVTTQYRISPGCRLDMRIEARDRANAAVSVLYSEHKIDGYWFSEGQIEREKAGLDAELAPNKSLVCVVSADELASLRAAKPEVPSGAVTAEDFGNCLSWRDVSRIAGDAGAAWPAPWGGSGWRQQALLPEAPACQRILMEFIAYLGEDEVPDALSANDLLALRLADEAQQKIESLLTLAAEQVAAFTLAQDDSPVYYSESSTSVPLTCVDFLLPDNHWLSDDEDSALSVAIAPTNAAAPQSEEEPQVYAGLRRAHPREGSTSRCDVDGGRRAAEPHSARIRATALDRRYTATRRLQDRWVTTGPSSRAG